MNSLAQTIAHIEALDKGWQEKAHQHLGALTMPYWALGRLLDLAQDLAGMTRSLQPPVGRKAVVTMAADHGVCAEGISKYPQEVTEQMVLNFVAGGAGINALAGQCGALVVIVDMGVAADLTASAGEEKILHHRIAAGTANIARGPAMSQDQAIASLEAGIAIAKDLGAATDVFGTGDMGIGNTTPSAAIVAAVTGVPAEKVTGPGTGIDDKQLAHKIKVVDQALAINQPDPLSGLDVLSKIGGFEIGGIAGLILGAAAQHKPVLIDGFISGAGALIAQLLCPAATDYMIASHRSAEYGHQAMLDKLGKQALLDLDLRLGEGTGAALAMNLVDAAVRVLTEVSTFEQADVSKAHA